MAKKKFILFLLIMTAVLGTYSFLSENYGFNGLDLNRIFYQKALNLETKGEYKEAYYAYKKVSTFYPAYDAVLYHQAQCASQIHDEKTVVKKLELLNLKYPKSRLAPGSYYRLGQAYSRTGHPKLAEKTFRSLANRYPESDYTIAAYYYVGLLNKRKDPGYAISLWKGYLAESPNGKFAIPCIKELQKIKAPLSNTDRANMGLAYYYGGNHVRAIQFLQNIPTHRTWPYLAKSYVATGQKAKASAIIGQGLRFYSKDFSAEELQEMIKLHTRLNAKPKQQSWQEVTNLAAGTKAYDYALFSLGTTCPPHDSIAIYNKLISYYPHSEYASDAMWELFWQSYKAHNYGRALQIAQMHTDKFQNKDVSPRIMFWAGKILEKQGRKRAASQYYDNILKNYSTSYYAFRANGRKRAINHHRDTAWRTKDSNRLCNVFYRIGIPGDAIKLKKKYGDSFWELTKAGDYDTLSEYGVTEKDVQSWINYQKGSYRKSCLQARLIVNSSYPNPDLGEPIMKLAFPLHYEDEINHFASKNDIDSALVISLLKEESYFDAKALSSSNAYGLMQLLPSTAAHIAKKRGITYHGKRSLFDPYTNIRLGTAYISSLYGLTDNMLFAVASYNAGPGAVQKWRQASRTNDLDEFVEDIPFKETQTYVKKVFRSYWCYSRMY